MQEAPRVVVLVKDGYVLLLEFDEESGSVDVALIRGEVLRNFVVDDIELQDEEELVRHIDDLIEEDKAGQVEDLGGG